MCIMKKFWPSRSKVRGFSIENLARRYQEKIANVPPAEISNQFSDESHIESINTDQNHIDISNLSCCSNL